MKEKTIQLSKEECEAFAEAVKEYKETSWNCDASTARLFAKMTNKWLINNL